MSSVPAIGSRTSFSNLDIAMKRSMRVNLKVLHGSNAGRFVKVPVPEFIIGRKEGCHLRPRSDMISRKHCMLIVSDSRVIVRDLKSRNGTFINGERVNGDRELKLGDHLKVGKLEFQVVIDPGLRVTTNPKVQDIKAAATPPAAAVVKKKEEGADVSDWLVEADTVELERRMTDPDTRQFKVNETDRVPMNNDVDSTSNTISGSDSDTKQIEKSDKNKKKEPGKLPPRPKTLTKDSRDAASQVLKDFFNRR